MIFFYLLSVSETSTLKYCPSAVNTFCDIELHYKIQGYDKEECFLPQHLYTVF